MFSRLIIETSSLSNLSKRLRNAADKNPDALRRAVNHTGDKARTAVRRVLVIQTGLKPKTINKAVQSTRASAKGNPSYVIKSRGGNIRLKYFAPRETRLGVTAAPWGKRKLYATTFMKGGQFPNRVALKLNGAVVMRAGRQRKPLVTPKSGLFIPKEMVTGASAQAFFDVVSTSLPARIAHEIKRTL